jgi:uncharacterized caspase-like protein
LVKSVFGKKRSWAVLIGIKDYSHKINGLDPLPYALNDVQAVKDYLITGLDFDKDNIKTLVDSLATREEIVKELGENIPGRVGTGDRVLVYFSVHGGKEIIKTDEGEKTYSYLIPYDGKKDNLYSTGISLDILSQLAELIEAKQVLFVIDARFSGNIGQIISKTGIYPKETKKEIETFINNKSREVMTAGTMDEEAVMGDKWNNHSVYTFYLLKGLRGARIIIKTRLLLYPSCNCTWKTMFLLKQSRHRKGFLSPAAVAGNLCSTGKEKSDNMHKNIFWLPGYLELQLCERIWSQRPVGANKTLSLEAD